MGREFAFGKTEKNEAFARQHGRCACCGDGLKDQMDNAHHVVPNQTGSRQKDDSQFVRSSDNCVYLCEPCHYRVHEDGRYQKGAVAGPEYYPHSHGNDTQAHQQWCQRVNQEWDRRFPEKAQSAQQDASSSKSEESRHAKYEAEYAEERKRQQEERAKSNEEPAPDRPRNKQR